MLQLQDLSPQGTIKGLSPIDGCGATTARSIHQEVNQFNAQTRAMRSDHHSSSVIQELSRLQNQIARRDRSSSPLASFYPTTKLVSYLQTPRDELASEKMTPTVQKKSR
jgi:hypothetical protein